MCVAFYIFIHLSRTFLSSLSFFMSQSPHAETDHCHASTSYSLNTQLLFLAGIILIIGHKKTFRFFFQWHKAKGTTCFLGGIALVLYGWAMVGILVEAWGFLNLFGDFFPTALCARLRCCAPTAHLVPLALAHRSPAAVTVRRGVLRNMPVIGNFLSLPMVRAVTDRLIAKSRLPV